MKESYLTFAMSVIVSRALPDVRDGLKPSQRRILIAMNDLGLNPRAKYRKCAKVCGDASGNYHPHGAQEVIYPTLARMAQDFNYRYPLVDGQGNFGSMDGDPPGAMRYTECRMAETAMAMIEDLDKDTVDFVPNYEGTRMEPVVLPAKFPNLLVNGCNGIAVGMATSIPPHNLREVCDALVALIDNPDTTVDDLARIVKGPDFPSGALICGRRGILNAYRTGRGTFIVRARSHIETRKSGRKNIIITEVPYLLNRDKILERIGELAQAGRIQGISDVRNESDRDGCRLVIELRKEADENVVLNQLYKHTALQSSFSMIMIALVRNRPVTLNLRQILQAYIDHRCEVVRRRTQYLLDKALQRAHVLEGLLIALQNIDAVIEMIKLSKTVEEARNSLMASFGLSETQAEAILQMRLQRLTALEQQKVEDEHRELLKSIEEYQAILASDERVLAIIKDEVIEQKEKFGDERRTEIVGEVEEISLEELIAEEDMVVTITRQGYIKRLPVATYRAQRRGGRGITGADMREGDFVEHLFLASTHDYILFFTSRGKVYWQKVYDLPELGRTSRGRAIVGMLELERGEKVTSMIPVRRFDGRQLVMVTKRGTIKKTALEAFSRPKRGGIIAIGLDPDDELVAVRITGGEDDLIIGTRDGRALRFSEQTVRSMGRTARGVRGIRLRQGDEVVGLVVVDPRATLLSVCENGYGKRTPYDRYTRHGRGGQGVLNIKATQRNGKVVGILDVTETDHVMAMTSGGMVVRMRAADISCMGRGTQGVRIMSLKEGDRVVSIARVITEQEEKGVTGLNSEPEEKAAQAAPEAPPTEAPPEEKEPSAGRPQADRKSLRTKRSRKGKRRS